MNVAEIIKKNFKKGDILYSPLFGNVELLSVVPADANFAISVAVTSDTGRVESKEFSLEGKYFWWYPNAECLIFPNRNKTWEGYCQSSYLT